MNARALSHATHRPTPTAPRLALAVAAAAAAVTTTLAPLPARASAFSFTRSVGTVVPDANDSGLVSKLVVPAGTGQILDVDVAVDLSGSGFGGWNGDLFLILSHDGTTSYLLNRVGRTAGDSLGYSDNGFVGLTFDDEAASDIHRYQSSPDYAAMAGGPITGTWQPDARSTDPGQVIDTDARDRFLAVFDSLNAEGEWRLLAADLASGSVVSLDRWSLILTTEPIAAPVPDTGPGLLALAGLSWLGLAAWTRSRRRDSRS